MAKRNVNRLATGADIAKREIRPPVHNMAAGAGTLKQPFDGLVPLPPVEPGSIRVTLARYVIHAEDDGVGGNGIDLYIGYLGAPSSALQMSSPPQATVQGTTTVRRGLTTGNGAGPRNVHPVEEAMFEVPIGRSGTAIGLNLIESDQTTALIKQAFAQARLPVFGQHGAAGITAPDLDAFFAAPFAPIMNLMKGANTDDDYGHWKFSAMPLGGSDDVRVSAYGGKNTHVDPQAIDIPPMGSRDIRLQYIDDDNDIEVVLRVDRI